MVGDERGRQETMIKTITTTITFKMPEEHEALASFQSRNDMTEWKEITDSKYASYSMTKTIYWRANDETD
jgi:hypothetical protein